MVWQFVKREVQSRYRGSWLGLSWSFLTPILMLAVYTFVFRVVFQSRWGNGNGTGLDFALHMYAGLVVFNFVAECVTRAPQLIVSQPNLVKKVVFPLELLAWVSILAALFHLAVNAVILVLFALAAGYVHATLLLLPLVWLPLLPLVLGGNAPGHEIEHPMAVVILGGLVSSTLLNLLVMPVLYLAFGRRAPTA